MCRGSLYGAAVEAKRLLTGLDYWSGAFFVFGGSKVVCKRLRMAVWTRLGGEGHS